jgi:hypothetical protein
MKKIAGGLVTVAAIALAVSGPATAAKPYTLPNPPGQYCKGVPKKKLAGHKKTQFAECVTAIAKLNKNNNLSTAQVCKGISKKKAKGQKRTPYSQCIAAAKKAKNDLGG